jgi:polyphosphate kinase
MTPIVEKSSQEKLYEMLQLQVMDNTLSWELQSDGEYIKSEINSEKIINNHIILEEYINKIYKTMKKDTSSNRAEILARKLFKES